MATKINVTFTSGIGNLTAKLFRAGAQIATGKLTTSGSIDFPIVQMNDVITINGACAGSATVSITNSAMPAVIISTAPITPKNYTGPIHDTFKVKKIYKE